MNCSRVIFLALIIVMCGVTEAANAEAPTGGVAGVWTDQPTGSMREGHGWPMQLVLMDNGTFLQTLKIPCDRDAPKPEPMAIAHVGHWSARGDEVRLDYKLAQLAAPVCECTGGGDERARMGCWVELGKLSTREGDGPATATTLALVEDAEKIAERFGRASDDSAQMMARLQLGQSILYMLPLDKKQPRTRAAFFKSQPYQASMISTKMLNFLGCELDPEYNASLQEAPKKMKRRSFEAPVICKP